MRSVEVARRGPRPPIRLRPAPASDPPFDDEIEPQAWATAHQLALDWGAAQRAAPEASSTSTTHPCDTPDPYGTTAAAPAGTAAAASVGTAAAASAGTGAAGPVVAGASAEARLAVRQFVGACVEVVNGYRPAAHLRRLSVPVHASAVVAQAIAANHRVSEMRRAAGRSTRSAARHGRRPDPVAVRGLRLCEPRPGAVEAAVLLITADRTWAMAIRLERHQQSWLATTLRLV